jgi:hypothetical protein
MPETINHDRRRFLGRTAMAIAAGQLGMSCTARANDGESPELAALGRAPGWLNSPRLTAASLGGKVVLVNFCTYTCINWLRTLPYVRAWAQKYSPGLVTIGVHTPEFAFEQNLANVRRAMKDMTVDYPIVIDNDYSIWRAFKNHYWPALYFIDARGRVREHHFGEGEYEWCEKTLERLLTEAGAPGVSNGVVSVRGAGAEAAPDWNNLKSPENYLGYARTERFASPGGARLNERRVFATPVRLALNQWAVAGEWIMTSQAAVHDEGGGRIVCRFHARDLHLVMGPRRRESPVRFRVSIDGQRPGSAHGADVDDDGNGTVADQRLYQLIRQAKPIVERTFEIEFLGGGVEAFAFTFG